MKLTNEEFINKAKSIHGDKYDYSKTQYINTRTKVIIICPIHGEFIQRPDIHLSKHGCPKCGNRHKGNAEDVIKRKNIFLQRANVIHNNKYDYSKVEFVNSYTKICIICPEHGEFWTTPERHVSNKVGCPVCKSKTQKCHKYLTNEEFIKKAKEIHGDKYDYSKINYINGQTKICIICPEHGEFWQTPAGHLRSIDGCPKCFNEKTSLRIKKTKEEFINDAIKIHGNKYDYSLVDYTDCKLKVKIICPIHGEFEQTPDSHIQGSGCPFCHESKLERQVYLTLIENNINFEREKTFPWLKKKKTLRLDFYLPDYNIAIECQGEQHYKDITFLTMKSNFNEIQERDKIKRNLCEKNGIKIIYYGRLKYDNVIITNIKKLLTEIKKYGNDIIVDP